MTEDRIALRASRWLPCLIACVLALPLHAQDVPRTMRATLDDGGVIIGDLQPTGTGMVKATNAAITWADGRTYTGAFSSDGAFRGTLRYPDGSSITGLTDIDDDGERHWWPLVSQVHTVRESALGPPGSYKLAYSFRGEDAAAWVFGAPFQPDRSYGGPYDAATLAKPTRNTKGCPKPSVVPAGWIVWWPQCKASPEAQIVSYSPDRTHMLTEWVFDAPDKKHLNILHLTRDDGKGYGADMLVEYGATSLLQELGGTYYPYKTNFYAKTAKPYSITAKAFTADAAPSPIGEGNLLAPDRTLLFKGTFNGQQPAVGVCRKPVNEGGGSEPCEFRNGQRIDPAHMLRQEQVAALKQEADMGPQQAKERLNRFTQEQDQRLAEEDERIRQRNRARDAVNEVNWGAVMNDVGDTFQRSADELEASRRENARRMEQARRSDEAYRAEQQRAAQRQAEQDAAQRQQQQQQLRTQQARAGGTGTGGSSLTLQVNQADDYGDTDALAARNEEISRRMREENELRLMKMKVQYMADGRACYAHPELQSPALQAKLDGNGCTSPGRSGGPGVVGDP